MYLIWMKTKISKLLGLGDILRLILYCDVSGINELQLKWSKSANNWETIAKKKSIKVAMDMLIFFITKQEIYFTTFTTSTFKTASFPFPGPLVIQKNLSIFFLKKEN